MNHLIYLVVVRSLELKKGSFRLCKNDEELLGPNVPYLSVIDSLVYFINCTCSNIVFSINLLARCSSVHLKIWNNIKHILCYFPKTTYIDLFY